MTGSKKESGRKRSLGELGELVALKALVDASFDKIRNFNDTKFNNPFFDLYAEKDGRAYWINVKARNKLQKNGQLNSRYKIGKDSQKYIQEARENNAEAAWIAVPFDETSYSVYFGLLENLKGANAIPTRPDQVKLVGEILQKERRHFFDWEYFSNNGPE